MNGTSVSNEILLRGLRERRAHLADQLERMTPAIERATGDLEAAKRTAGLAHDPTTRASLDALVADLANKVARLVSAESEVSPVAESMACVMSWLANPNRDRTPEPVDPAPAEPQRGKRVSAEHRFRKGDLTAAVMRALIEYGSPMTTSEIGVLIPQAATCSISACLNRLAEKGLVRGSRIQKAAHGKKYLWGLVGREG